MLFFFDTDYEVDIFRTRFFSAPFFQNTFVYLLVYFSCKKSVASGYFTFSEKWKKKYSVKYKDVVLI